RRRVEHGQAAPLLELLRRDVGRVRRLRRVLDLGEVEHDDARVLRVEVHLAARERLVGELGRAEAALVDDMEALRLERLGVETGEDGLLAAVLRAERDGRLRPRRRGGRRGRAATAAASAAGCE